VKFVTGNLPEERPRILNLNNNINLHEKLNYNQENLKKFARQIIGKKW
jgi:hypothetical protein